MPAIVKFGPWILAVLGLATIVVTVIYGTIVGDWVDENQAVAFPDALPLFALGVLGLGEFILGLVVGIASLTADVRLASTTSAAG
jgi:hypothetical protein